MSAEAIVLPGGHSPFLARPDALADVLDAAASLEARPTIETDASDRDVNEFMTSSRGDKPSTP